MLALVLGAASPDEWGAGSTVSVFYKRRCSEYTRSVSRLDAAEPKSNGLAGYRFWDDIPLRLITGPSAALLLHFGYIWLMRVKLFMSVSMNGMIGRPNGRGDFFSDICWHGFVDIVRAEGALIFGRSTFEIGREWPSFRRDLVGSPVRGIVLTSDPSYLTEEGWEAACSPIQALNKLNDRGLSSIVVAGGTSANAAFLRENLVDEITLFVESVIISSGLPLVPGGLGDVPCRLISATCITDTVARLDFAVGRDSGIKSL